MSFLRKKTRSGIVEESSQSGKTTFVETCIKRVTTGLKNRGLDQKRAVLDTEEGNNVQWEELNLPLKIKTQSNFSKNELMGEVSLVQVLSPNTVDNEFDNKFERKSEEQIQLPGMARDSLYTSLPTPKIITNVKFNNNGNYLAASFSDFNIYIYGLMSNIHSHIEKDEDTNDTNNEIRTSKLQYYEKNTQKTLIFNYTNSITGPHINSEPYRIWKGHKSQITQFCWSPNDFFASYSNDNNIIIWHLEKNESLCCLSHFSMNITSISFHPSDDRYLIVTSSDKKIRLWSLDECKVISWNETNTQGIFTSVSFTPDATMCVAGTSEGEVVFYELPNLKYHTQISLAKKSSSKTRINSIEHIKSSWDDEHRLLITTTDSNIKMYNICDKSLYMKFRGFQCTDSPIMAITFMSSIVLSPSEDNHIYFWDATPLELIQHGIKKMPDLHDSTLSIKNLSRLVRAQKLNSAYGLMNWIRFRLPRCTDSGVPTVSIVPLFKFNNTHKSENNTFKNHTSYDSSIIPFILAVGVNDVVCIYINE